MDLKWIKGRRRKPCISCNDYKEKKWGNNVKQTSYCNEEENKIDSERQVLSVKTSLSWI